MTRGRRHHDGDPNERPSTTPANPGAAITVGILIFDDVEVLDFAGPFEVFGVTRAASGDFAFQVETLALEPGLVVARNELEILCRRSALEAAHVDVLVAPGGYGTRREMHNPAMLETLRRLSASAQLTLSVCTGSLMLGAAGLLRGQAATTHAGAMDELRALDCCEVLPDARVGDNGRIVTSAGISAGLDASLHVVGRLVGEVAAMQAARYMQYDWRWEGLVRRAT